MNLPPLSFIVLDTETTGFIPRVNRVIEFASVRVEEGKIVSEYEQLFSIPTDIPEPVQVLTRIRPEALDGKPAFKEKREEILKTIGDGTLIIGQNVSFDLKMLKGEGIDLSDHPWIDTSMLASLVFPELASYSLSYVSTILKLKHDPVHRALGDVSATLELLGRCWERLCELPPELHEVAKLVMEKSSAGYQLLFGALPDPTASSTPSWLRIPKPVMTSNARVSPLARDIFQKPKEGAVTLVEEPLDPTTLQQLLDAAVGDESTVHWIAVKNLEATLQRLSVSREVGVLYPPSLLLDLDAATTFAGQETYTAAEGTLALKLAWYEPQHYGGIPIHGEERAVWNGKLACTDSSETYVKQFENLPSVILLDHRQLLAFLADPAHAAHNVLDERAHIIIDDASMLEDTASRAYGWWCSLDDMRAGSEGNEAMTSFTDILQIWIEKTRESRDTHYLTKAHLQTPEAKGLAERLENVLKEATLATSLRGQLLHLKNILDSRKIDQRIAWIEQRQNGSQSLRSVPEWISDVLEKNLYRKFPTTLLIPPQCEETLTEILPAALNKNVVETSDTEQDLLPVIFEFDKAVDSFMKKPPGDRIIVLLPSRRLIEEFFVSFTEEMEKKGITLICQNLSGGLMRMQAEFAAASPPCIWLLTPWTYESVTLPPGMIDHLIIQSLPFDHPSWPVFSKRSEHYQDAFQDYSLPRLEHRLFRLLRTFCRHRMADAGVAILDKRIETKNYGERIRTFIEQFSRKRISSGFQRKKPRKHSRRKEAGKIPEEQMTLF